MISIIAAMTKINKVIGKDNKLPWNIPSDLKNFKKLTTDSVVIMGRKTYESIPKKFRPLPNRINIVLSRSTTKENYPQEDILIANNPEQAINQAKTYNKPVFIIGGAQIYQLLEPFADTMHLSFIKKEYEGNTKFPEINWDNWKPESTEDMGEFELTIFKRNSTNQ